MPGDWRNLAIRRVFPNRVVATFSIEEASVLPEMSLKV
jgi:hypothetical protein